MSGLSNRSYNPSMTLNCKGALIDIAQAQVMGILNLTPDSFYDGGRYTDGQKLLRQTERMLEEGARFIDIGAYSSRPGADQVSEEEEIGRLLPALELLLTRFPEILISVDTFRAKVARDAIGMGASMINDISAGLLDPKMLPTIAELQVPYIMMHMRGNPKTMRDQTDYGNLLLEIQGYFSERLAQARGLGIHDIVIDPGFGFAKNLPQNYELLQKLNLLSTFHLPILVGLSRKSMIYKTLGTDAENALNGTTALHMKALEQGANILRVHDVKQAMECIRLNEQFIV